MKISICLLIFLTAMIAPGNLYAQEKQTVGWIEKAHITPGDITLDAKLDTGADSCSVNALDIKEFERDGRTWVRFTIADKKGQKVTLEREMVGVKKVKRHGCPNQERYVVNLGICIGNYYSEIEVGLVDRRVLKYPLLIGRNFMAGRLIPDPSVEYTTKPACQEK
ncbi:MAG: ATP-dependent zinc protease [Desulfomonilaceae bacterium]|nr:RimK/LysX family protein [Syntrophaceae bacterium]